MNKFQSRIICQGDSSSSDASSHDSGDNGSDNYSESSYP